MLNIYTEGVHDLILKEEPQQEKEKPLRILVYVNCLWPRESEPQVVEDQESVQRSRTVVSGVPP